MFILTILACFHAGPLDAYCEKFVRAGLPDFKSCAELVAPYKEYTVELAAVNSVQIFLLEAQCAQAEDT